MNASRKFLVVFFIVIILFLFLIDLVCYHDERTVYIGFLTLLIILFCILSNRLEAKFYGE